jgi:hypothetical protein
MLTFMGFFPTLFIWCLYSKIEFLDIRLFVGYQHQAQFSDIKYANIKWVSTILLIFAWRASVSMPWKKREKGLDQCGNFFTRQLLKFRLYIAHMLLRCARKWYFELALIIAQFKDTKNKLNHVITSQEMINKYLC